MSVGYGIGRRFVVGTRGSALALAQAGRVVAALEAAHTGIRIDLRAIRTEGDADKTSPLTEIGGRGVFTSGLQAALLAGDIDLAVHSAKDLPARSPEGIVIAAFPEREDARDVVVSRHGCGLAELPERPVVGTSSRRRAMQVLLLRPDARIVDLRGNIDTRLDKAATDYDAVVLAAAGLVRLGLGNRACQRLPIREFVPAPGQGALAVEARGDDAEVLRLLAAIDDPAASLAVRAERAFLRALGAGCTTPLGVHVWREGDRWRLCAVYGDAADPTRPPARVERAIDPRRAEAEAEATALALAAEAGRGSGALRRRVLVTRARDQAGSLVQALSRAGAEPVPLPTIRIAGPADDGPLTAALERAARGEVDWIAFTSANAVEAVAGALRRRGQGPAALSPVRLAAVGRATAAALAEHGFPAALVPEDATAEGLADAMAASGVAGRRVLYPRGDLARDALVASLRGAGAEVVEVEAYRTVPEPDVDPRVLAQVERGDVEVVTFASPSSVRNLITLLDGDVSALAKARVVCVGRVTARAAAEHGLPPFAVAEDASVDGLVAASLAALDDPDLDPDGRRRAMPPGTDPGDDA